MRSELSRGELDAMLSMWRRCNAAAGVTGFVLYHRGQVFQVIEGFPDVIASLYETIARDPRHRVAKCIDESIGKRSFGDWSMGKARLASTDLGALAPLGRFVDPAFQFTDCDEATGRALIAAFTTGPWRRTIH